MDLVIPQMLLLFSVETAGQVFCAFVLLSTAPAVTLLHYALHKKLSLWPLLSLLFVYNSIFVMGFLNYLLGLNLALAASALWILSSQKRAAYSVPLFSAVTLLLYFVHLSALGVYTLIVFGYEMSAYLDTKRRASSSTRDSMGSRTAAVRAGGRIIHFVQSNLSYQPEFGREFVRMVQAPGHLQRF